MGHTNYVSMEATLCYTGTLATFAHHTCIASSEDSTSICMVIPILMELELHLKEVSLKTKIL